MEAIRYYVKGAFQGVAETPEVLEQQEELIADIGAKVEDLVTDGRTPEEALGVAIASVGDLSALVAEFVAEQDARVPAPSTPVIPTADVYVGDLDFHVAVVSVGLAAAFMLFCTVLGAVTGAIDRGAGLVLLMVLGVAAWWVTSAYQTRTRAAADTDTRALVYRPRLLKALGVWAAVCFLAMVANIATGTDFWFWPIWVAATVLPLSVLVEWYLVRGGMFVVDAPEPPAAAAPGASA